MDKAFPSLFVNIVDGIRDSIQCVGSKLSVISVVVQQYVQLCKWRISEPYEMMVSGWASIAFFKSWSYFFISKEFFNAASIFSLKENCSFWEVLLSVCESISLRI